MTEQRVHRRLAAILAADVVGYSALMERDEEATYAEFERFKRELIEPCLSRHEGRLIKTTGDGALAEFASPLSAMRCAVEMQDHLASGSSPLRLRIGLNLGDVIVGQDGDLYGEGINIAVRLEGIADRGGILISEKVYSEVEGKVDVGFEDRGVQLLKNISRPVHTYAVRAGAHCAATEGPSAALPLPDKPSIAVLPFQNMSGDREQEYFADGMVEEIITALSRIRWLFVVARNSSFTYKGRAVDVTQVGRELGVRYVLEGSVRKAGSRIRITGQLIDAVSAAHLWADHFDGPLDDVFDIQDKVAIAVAGVIEPALVAAEIRRSIQRQTTHVTAYDLFLRARAEAMAWEKHRLLRALDLLRRAMEFDPYYGPALVLAAQCHQNLHLNDWGGDAESERQQSIELARRGLRASGDDPYVLGEAAFVVGYFEHDIEPAIVLIDRSLELNPSFAIGWFRSGWLRLWAGQIDLGIEHFENSLRLNPLRPAPASFGIAVGHFFAGRLESAAMMMRLSLQENPTWPPCYRFLASCCAHLGRLDEARAIIERLRDITPAVIPRAEHWRVQKQREFFLEGLRLAAGETK
ncbi:adenylate/guanylate cyclase domain-containing protein [Bradyrhizobium ganzhouense]|uniref:adenylate/guanylate cyclase domain-containing protein n=1 Tax=Bradyrhizobium ganzhouense TaxID=1179767 RepID=UPI003CE8D345